MSLFAIGFLILFPLVVAAVLAFVKKDSVRNPIVYASALIIAVVSLGFVVANLGTGYVELSFYNPVVDYACLALGVAIAAIIFYFGILYRNIPAIVLAAIQVIGSVVFDLGFAHEVVITECLYFDSLSLIMTLIIGIVGSGICVYALGYMQDFQAHEPEGAKDRRPLFFALMFAFLSAMYVIVFSNNLSWMFTGWEVTTVCSFLLIGYTRTDEAIRNAFRQIIMNLIGGIAFLVALYFIVLQIGTLSLREFIEVGTMYPIIVMLPVCCLGLAGLTKAAQMPFHTWLLGAMVAPTPTSALLHSSTMVKAGVFLLVKLAPVFNVCPLPQIMIVLIGGITFLLCSFMAISQTNAKRVLAYSTIANLGLIVACAGVGTPEAVWAACFLILFHAVAKSLLFLCVGTAEHHIGSRDIESMDLLFNRMPKLARFMMLGIMIMFIAPLGMLMAKWATLVSFADNGQLALIIILGFGSAATFFFWAKWLGKLSGIASAPENVEVTVHKSEWIALYTMVVLAVIACVGIPFISLILVNPYVASVAQIVGSPQLMALFAFGGQDIAYSNLWISALLSVVIIVMLFAGVGRSQKTKQADVYLAGISVDNEHRTFRNSLSGETAATTRNFYLDSIFNEGRIRTVGEWMCGALIVVAILLSITGLPILM